MRLPEELQILLLSYFDADDLITLSYVSKHFRRLVLKIFSQIYEISTGFFSVTYRTKVIQENIFNLIQEIYKELWDTFPFDFEQNYELLIKKYHDMPLFSVSLHFVRCRRSCEKQPAYCRFCARIRENNYYEYNAFLSWKLRNNECLNIGSSERVDFDVF